MDGWHKCSDCLPNLKEKVLTWSLEGGFCIAWRFCADWFDDDPYIVWLYSEYCGCQLKEDPTHWMELSKIAPPVEDDV